MSRTVAQVRSNSQISCEGFNLYFFIKVSKMLIKYVNLIADVSLIFQNASKSRRLRFNFELNLSILQKG